MITSLILFELVLIFPARTTISSFAKLGKNISSIEFAIVFRRGNVFTFIGV